MKKFYDPAFIYSYLVFMGFYNYYIFYSYFDIKISTFLSLSELLLSFLGISFPILITLLVFVYFLFVAMILIDVNPKEKDKNSEERFVKLKKAKYLIKKAFLEGNYKSLKTYKELLINFNRLIKELIILIFLYVFPFYIFMTLGVGRSFPVLHSIPFAFLFMLSFVWLLYTETYIIKWLKISNNTKKYMWLILAIFIAFSLLTIYNREKAQKILVGSAEFDVEFEYNKILKKTNSSIIFIGMTENYMFLRDLKSNENLIYRRSDIKLLKMKKTNFKKYFNEQYSLKK